MLWEFLYTTCLTRVVARVGSLEVGGGGECFGPHRPQSKYFKGGNLIFFSLNKFYIFGPNERNSVNDCHFFKFHAYSYRRLL